MKFESIAPGQVVFHRVCLRRVCLRSDGAKLIENFVSHVKFADFVMLPDEETGSAEEQPASNKAAPILIVESHRESSCGAAPFS